MTERLGSVFPDREAVQAFYREMDSSQKALIDAITDVDLGDVEVATERVMANVRELELKRNRAGDISKVFAARISLLRKVEAGVLVIAGIACTVAIIAFGKGLLEIDVRAQESVEGEEEGGVFLSGNLYAGLTAAATEMLSVIGLGVVSHYRKKTEELLRLRDRVIEFEGSLTQSQFVLKCLGYIGKSNIGGCHEEDVPLLPIDRADSGNVTDVEADEENQNEEQVLTVHHGKMQRGFRSKKQRDIERKYHHQIGIIIGETDESDSKEKDIANK